MRRNSNPAIVTLPLTGLLLAALLVVATACASDEASTIETWFDTTRDIVVETEPDSDVMQIDPNQSCRLVDEFVLEEEPLELTGAAAAKFGEVGDRYQCAWSGDEDLSANVRLEVVVIDEQADFDEYAALVPTREDNEVISTDVGVVQVASFTPEDTDRSVTTAVLVLPEQRGGVQLVVELLDPETTLDWTAEEYGELLASLAT